MNIIDLKEKEEENYLINTNTKLRNYQENLIQTAKKQNSIIFLPTGTGKTLIAVHILCSRKSEIVGPFPGKAKRVFFVTPTKVLVYQLYKTLSIHTKFKIGMFTGDMFKTFWDKEKWQEQFREYQVIILTGEILKQILELNFIAPSQISLIVLDECHHAILQHPYQIILNIIAKEPLQSSPLLLGLTAVLLKANPKLKGVSSMVNTLKTSFRGVILTADKLSEAQSFASNPEEKLVRYTFSTSSVERFLPYYDEVINILNELTLTAPESPVIPESSRSYTNKNPTKRYKNWIVSARETLEECGIFCGALSILYYIILIEKYRLMATNADEIQVLVYCRTALYKLRHILLSVLGEETAENIFNTSSDKIQILLSLLVKNSKVFKDSHISTMIFVQKKVTAILITTLLKKLKGLDDDFSFLKPEFIIGSSLSDSETFTHDMNNETIIKEFSRKNLNTVVCTNVLEEGIDVSACNVVISFNFPVSYSNYFQIRGRARDKSGVYYMFVRQEELKQKHKVLNEFKQVEEELYKIIVAPDDEDFDETANPADDDISSFPIRTVHRYCSKLPQDRYSYLSPTAWYKEVPGGKKGFVQLPVNCALREVVEGEVKSNRRSAKKSAFAETLKRLKQIGEIDENFNPISFREKARSFDYLFPHFKEEKPKTSSAFPGSKRRKQVYDVKFAESLSECLPLPGEKTYVHVMEFSFKFDKPEREDKKLLQEVLESPVTFAILSSKKLCRICQFPMFLDLGQIDCNLLINHDEVVFSEPELEDIRMCHFAVFEKILLITKKSQVFDNTNKGHSFYIAPVKKDESGRFELDWEIIRCDFCRGNKSAVVSYNPYVNRNSARNSSDVMRRTLVTSNAVVPVLEGREFCGDYGAENPEEPAFVLSEAYYKYFVISPSYRNVHPPQLYIVRKFCTDLTPRSPFPRTTYADYFAYYEDKYLIRITNMNQPLMKVASVYSCSNYNKPVYLDIQDKGKKAPKTQEELLVPELCDIFLFDRRYWVKALLIPTALNRICHLYYVDEFRKKLNRETGLGVVDLPSTREWKPLELDLRIYKKKEKNVSGPLSMALPLSQLKTKAKAEEKFVDLQRNLLEVSACDLEYLVNIFKKLDSEEEYVKSMLLPPKTGEASEELKSRQGIAIPSLKTLEGTRNPIGPELGQLVQAFTSTSCNDIFNYERLETLGDAFLKFAVTIFLFKHVHENEGMLTFLKGKLVGNRNLLYCGLVKGFQYALNVYEFTPLSDWNPPLLHLPEKLVDALRMSNADPAVIYRWDIPPEEQFSGNLSEETLSKNLEIVWNYERACSHSSNALLPFRSISDKVISDSVEAIIGVYLWELGLRGGFEILMWLNVLPSPVGSYSETMEEMSYSPLFSNANVTSVMNILDEVFYLDLEESLGYTFKNKALLLEAITHPSYARNRVTDCYQRLEFLGDAILDFLITSYIYEYCEDKSPGEITDIRSALVNNLTFASLAVRYDFHKYLLKLSSWLNKAIEEFVTHQANRNHVVDDNVLILLEESDCSMAESVQVPKALGDIFESIAGAIYLDSGNSLATVWAIYYRLMKSEIDSFTKETPKSPVRLLHEICENIPLFEAVQLNRDVMQVACTVWYDNIEIKVYGLGSNKKEAKRSAAKLAVKKISELKK